MKNKGFVFVETIVVIVILSLGLVMVYQSFVNVLSNNKRRASYNDIAYIYRTYYIEEFLTNLNLEDYIDYYLGPEVKDGDKYVHGGKKLQVFSCNNPILYNIDANITEKNVPDFAATAEGNKKSFCEQLVSQLKVKNIYITNYNVNDIKKCTTRAGKLSSDNSCNMSFESNRIKYDALNQMTPSMIYYLRTLNGTEDNTYRLIIEYEEEEIDADKTITKVKKNGELKCPSAYQENPADGVCYKKVSKRYYSNVALVKKDSASALINKILGLGTSDLEYDGSDKYGDYRTSDNNLRYVSTDTDPKNYIYFNCTTTVADKMNDTTCEKWRIIGVFNNVEDDKYNKASRVKIIRDEPFGDEPSGGYAWDTSKIEINNGSGYNQWGEATYEDGTQYKGADLMRELNNDYLGNITVAKNGKWFNSSGGEQETDMPDPKYFINETYEKMIQPVNWSVGATPSNQYYTQIPLGSMYSHERSINLGYEYNGTGTPKDTLNRNTSWVGKVALPYLSDYVYAISSDKILNCLGNNSTLSVFAKCDPSWMNANTNRKWVLTPYGRTDDNSLGFTISNSISPTTITEDDLVYPTLYLKNDVRVIGGDGSKETPYKIKR